MLRGKESDLLLKTSCFALYSVRIESASFWVMVPFWVKIFNKSSDVWASVISAKRSKMERITTKDRFMSIDCGLNEPYTSKCILILQNW